MALYIAIPIVIIAIHLIAIKKEWREVKSVSKVFLIPYIFLAFSAVTGSLNIRVPHMGLLMAVMAFYTLGDLLLEFNKLFTYGGLSFAIGHILYSAFFLLDGYSMGLGLIFIGIWVFIYIFLFEPELKFARPNSTKYLIYAVFVMILGVAVGAADFGSNWFAKILAFAGTLSYAFSDALVIIRQCRDESKQEKTEDDLLIMVTYIGANILLLAGITLRCMLA